MNKQQHQLYPHIAYITMVKSHNKLTSLSTKMDCLKKKANEINKELNVINVQLANISNQYMSSMTTIESYYAELYDAIKMYIETNTSTPNYLEHIQTLIETESQEMMQLKTTIESLQMNKQAMVKQINRFRSDTTRLGFKIIQESDIYFRLLCALE